MESIITYLTKNGYKQKVDETITEQQLDTIIKETGDFLSINEAAGSGGATSKGWNLFGFFSAILGITGETSASQQAKEEVKKKEKADKAKFKADLKAKKDQAKAALIKAKAALKSNQNSIMWRNKIAALNGQIQELKALENNYKKNEILYTPEQVERLNRGMDKVAQGMDPEQRDEFDAARTQLNLATIKAEDKDGKRLMYDPESGKYYPAKVDDNGKVIYDANGNLQKADNAEPVDASDVTHKRCTGDEAKAAIAALPDSTKNRIRKICQSHGVDIDNMSNEEWETMVADVSKNDATEDVGTLEVEAQNATQNLNTVEDLRRKVEENNATKAKLESIEGGLDKIKEDEKKLDDRETAWRSVGDNATDISTLGDNADTKKETLKTKYGFTEAEAQSYIDAGTDENARKDLIRRVKERVNGDISTQRTTLKARKQTIIDQADGTGVEGITADTKASELAAKIEERKNALDEDSANKCRECDPELTPDKVKTKVEEARRQVQTTHSNLEAARESGSQLGTMFETAAEEAKEDIDNDNPVMKKANDAVRKQMEGLQDNECYDAEGNRGFWRKNADEWEFVKAPKSVEDMKKYNTERQRAAALYPENPGNTTPKEGEGFAKGVSEATQNLVRAEQPKGIRHKLVDDKVQYEYQDKDGEWHDCQGDDSPYKDLDSQQLEILTRQRSKNKNAAKTYANDMVSKIKNALDAEDPTDEQKELLEWAKENAELLEQNKYIDSEQYDRFFGEINDWDENAAGEEVEGENDLEDETEDEKAKNQKADRGEDGKRINPSKVWKQRNYKNNPSQKTKSFYNKKGDSISQKEYNEKMKNYREYVQSHKKHKKEDEGSGSTQQDANSLTPDSSNMLTEHIGLRDYLTHRWS